jgi:hypothetical protein
MRQDDPVACTRCGCLRYPLGSRPPEPFVCSECWAEEWRATRKPSAAEVKRRARAYLDERYPARVARREAVLLRAAGPERGGTR